MTSRLSLFALILCCVSGTLQDEHVHQGQVHLSLGVDHTEMIVTWTTLKNFHGTPEVHYGKKGTKMDHVAHAERTEFKDEHSHYFTFRALLTKLEANTVYEYKVGSTNASFSKTHHFRTLKPNKDLLPRFAIVGDLGLENGRSIPYLKKDTEKSMYDVLFHIGDIAYNLFERNGHQGHDYMELIEPIASSLPYMTCPGNHEKHGNFSHYDARFSMLAHFTQPKAATPLSHRLNNHHYSLDIGPAHIIMFSSEFYFYPEFYGHHSLEAQYKWLEEDLKKANANRKEHPWIIVMAHRPLYCFNCKGLQHGALRLGPEIKGVHVAGLEKLFYKYGVDLQFYGHQHHFARTLPVHDMVVKSHHGNDHHFQDPLGPIHYITGSGGCREEHTKFNGDLSHVKFLGFYRVDYGYTRLTFVDKMKLRLEQTSVDHDGKVMDSIEVSKTHPNAAWMH